MKNGPLEDVFPIEHADIPGSYVSSPEGNIFGYIYNIYLYIYIYVHLVNFWLSCHGAGLFQANITDLQILYDTDLENFSHLAIFTRFAVLFEGETKPKTSLLPACLLFSFL